MRYEVKAVLARQGTVFLELDADNEEEARLQVAAQGGMVLNVRRRFSGWVPKRKLRFPLAHFSQELLSLLAAGLSLVESIETLADKEQDAGTRKIIQGLLARLYEGVTFSGLWNPTRRPFRRFTLQAQGRASVPAICPKP